MTLVRTRSQLAPAKIVLRLDGCCSLWAISVRILAPALQDLGTLPNIILPRPTMAFQRNGLGGLS